MTISQLNPRPWRIRFPAASPVRRVRSTASLRTGDIRIRTIWEHCGAGRRALPVESGNPAATPQPDRTRRGLLGQPKYASAVGWHKQPLFHSFGFAGPDHCGGNSDGFDLHPGWLRKQLSADVGGQPVFLDVQRRVHAYRRPIPVSTSPIQITVLYGGRSPWGPC